MVPDHKSTLGGIRRVSFQTKQAWDVKRVPWYVLLYYLHLGRLLVSTLYMHCCCLLLAHLIASYLIVLFLAFSTLRDLTNQLHL